MAQIIARRGAGGDVCQTVVAAEACPDQACEGGPRGSNFKNMKLPLADEAEVPRAKIVLYLLNPEHRAGKGKARFFVAHGFAVEDWQKLTVALRQHARDHEITKEEPVPLGVRFVVEGDMTMPDGATPDGAVAGIRSVWFIERGERTPRFVTAYPLKRKKQL
jgi:hypothetical protein